MYSCVRIHATLPTTVQVKNFLNGLQTHRGPMSLTYAKYGTSEQPLDVIFARGDKLVFGTSPDQPVFQVDTAAPTATATINGNLDVIGSISGSFAATRYSDTVSFDVSGGVAIDVQSGITQLQQVTTGDAFVSGNLTVSSQHATFDSDLYALGNVFLGIGNAKDDDGNHLPGTDTTVFVGDLWGSSFLDSQYQLASSATTGIGRTVLAVAGKTLIKGDLQVEGDTTLAGYNLGLIASNQTQITDALAAIAGNDADISGNAAAISTNATSIATTLASITTTQENIAAAFAILADGDSSTDINDLAASIKTTFDTIGTNQTAIADNLAAIAGNDVDISGIFSKLAPISYDGSGSSFVVDAPMNVNGDVALLGDFTVENELYVLGDTFLGISRLLDPKQPSTVFVGDKWGRDEYKEQVGEISASSTTLAVADPALFKDSVTIEGDLIVKGNTTTVNSTTLDLFDPVITLRSNGSEATGIEFKNESNNDLGSITLENGEFKFVAGGQEVQIGSGSAGSAKGEFEFFETPASVNPVAKQAVKQTIITEDQDVAVAGPFKCAMVHVQLAALDASGTHGQATDLSIFWNGTAVEPNFAISRLNAQLDAGKDALELKPSVDTSGVTLFAKRKPGVTGNVNVSTVAMATGFFFLT